MHHYVWTTEKMGRLGRPAHSSVDDYQRESEVKIAYWKREQQNSSSTSIRARLMSKIRALRLRMKQKMNKLQNFDLASY